MYVSLSIGPMKSFVYQNHKPKENYYRVSLQCNLGRNIYQGKSQREQLILHKL